MKRITGILASTFIAAGLSAGIASSASASTHPVVEEVTGFTPTATPIVNNETKPGTLYLSYGPIVWFTGLHWSSWGNTATGKGTLWGDQQVTVKLGSNVTIVLSDIRCGNVAPASGSAEDACYYEDAHITGERNAVLNFTPLSYWHWVWGPKQSEGWASRKAHVP
jgi:hypothetical protein